MTLRPAAEVGDRAELRRRAGSPLANSLATVGSTGRKPACAQRLLRRGRVEEVDERLGLLGCLVVFVTATGFSILNVVSGGDVLDLLAAALEEQRLVLVGEQHVAGALQERLRRLAAGLRLDLDVVGDELVEVREARLRVLAAVALVGVRREQVPLRRARAERVRRDDLDARLAGGRPTS